MELADLLLRRLLMMFLLPYLITHGLSLAGFCSGASTPTNIDITQPVGFDSEIL